VLNCLLRDIGKYGVGSAERDHSHFGKEHRNLAEHVLCAEHDQQGNHRGKPQRKPICRHASSPTDRRIGVIWSLITEKTLLRMTGDNFS